MNRAGPSLRKPRVVFVGGVHRVARELTALGDELGVDVRLHDGDVRGHGTARLTALDGRHANTIPAASATARGEGATVAPAAARGAGWHKTIAEATEAMAGRPIRTFVPDEKRHARYEALRAIHADLWPKVAEWNTRLVNFADQA